MPFRDGVVIKEKTRHRKTTMERPEDKGWRGCLCSGDYYDESKNGIERAKQLMGELAIARREKKKRDDELAMDFNRANFRRPCHIMKHSVP